MGYIYQDKLLGEKSPSYTNGVLSKESEGLNPGYNRRFSAQEALAEESGINPRRIYEIRYKDGNVLFETADKLFTAMDIPYVWYTDPLLSDLYRKLGE